MYMDIFFAPILWTLVVVFLFGGLFMRGFAAYVLIIFGAVFTIIPIRSYFTQKTILLIMGAYILGVLLVRAIAHAVPGRAERMNMALAGFFDRIFVFVSGKSLTDRLREWKKAGEDKQ